jgi:hypothetical protein
MTDLADLADATHAESPDRLPNGGMQQTRSALTPIGAALAADPRCSADSKADRRSGGRPACSASGSLGVRILAVPM